MDSEPALDTRLDLSIPRLGLEEIRRGWSGSGSIYEDLAAVSTVEALDWTAADIRRRASRVLLGLLEPICQDWPTTSLRWEEFLPSSTVSEPSEMRVPAGGVNWLETRRRHGWPPRSFSGRSRRRVVDEVTLQTLAWLTVELQRVVADVRPQSPTTAERMADRLAVIDSTLAEWADIAPARPDRLDLLALSSSGYPWHTVAAAAQLAVRAERDPEFIAFELIAPDPEVGWRLFHLATYGMVIRALRNHRFVLSWRRPISGTRSGAQIEAIGPSGTRFDLWFEAGAARTAYGLPASTYQDAVDSIVGAGGPIGVDVMLIERGSKALLLECKWSSDPSYVGRYGYHQTASYALDAIGGLAPEAWSFVVGPQEVVPATNVALALYDQLGVVLGRPRRCVSTIWLAPFSPTTPRHWRDRSEFLLRAREVGLRGIEADKRAVMV